MNIYDVARRAGVSIATVSRVLNDSPKVSAKTREKVLAVMREEGYTPNVFARGLGLGTMSMVGVLCTDVADLYYATAVASLERSLKEAGFNPLLCCTGHELEGKKEAIELLLSKNVDAIFLVGSSFKEQSGNAHIEAAAKQAPVFVINGLVECPGVYCVLCDEKQAMRESVLLLHKHGCRNILYLYNADTYSGIQKLEGLRKGLLECGIAPSPETEQFVPKDVEAVRERVRRLLNSSPEIDGILASEDILAVGALKAMDQGNLLPVIGFNNSVIAACATPALTSVDNMVESLCITAVGMLKGFLNGKKPPDKIMVSAKLVERETFRLDSAALAKNI